MTLIESSAIVLRTYQLKETDKIAVFFTEDHGQVRGIAHGARRMKSKFGGALEPFSLIHLVYWDKNEGLASINQAELINGFPRLHTSLPGIALGLYYVNLLLSYTIEGSQNRELFIKIKEILHLCETGIKDPETMSRYAELQILKTSGFAPRFSICQHCQKPIEFPGLFYNPRDVNFMCRNCAASVQATLPLPLGTSAFLQAALDAPPELIARTVLSEKQNRLAKEALKWLLLYHFGTEPRPTTLKEPFQEIGLERLT